MANQTGQKDQALITGRIAYGYDGTNAYPIKTDVNGSPIIAAGTANIGDVDITTIAAGTTVIGKVGVTVTETIQTELLATVAVAASTQAASSTLSLVSVKKATFFIDHGRSVVTAFGTNGTEYRVEVSQKAAGNDTWCPVASVLADLTVAVAITAGGTTIAAGTSLITSGTTGCAAGDFLFWANTTSTALAASSSEWMKVASVVADTSITFLDPLTYTHLASALVYNKAERFVVVMNTEPFTRARVIVNNNASGTTYGVFSRVACITEV